MYVRSSLPKIQSLNLALTLQADFLEWRLTRRKELLHIYCISHYTSIISLEAPFCSHPSYALVICSLPSTSLLQGAPPVCLLLLPNSFTLNIYIYIYIARTLQPTNSTDRTLLYIDSFPGPKYSYMQYQCNDILTV